MFIQAEHTAAARKLVLFDDDWQSESFIFVEFSNVLATYERAGRLGHLTASEILKRAEQFMRARLSDVSHLQALEAPWNSECPPTTADSSL